VDETEGELAPAYNVAPTDPVPIVRVSSAGHRAVSAARWGLVPHWSKDPKSGARMINARAERVATAPAFARAFTQHRCLIPADGWYEWRKRAGSAARGGKQPYFMTRRDNGVLAFAGVWAQWGSGPDRLRTCSVITTTAVGKLAGVHDRMPLILFAERWAEWLGASGDATTLLRTPDLESLACLEIRPVGVGVGDVRNDGPGLIEWVPEAGPIVEVESDPLPMTLTLPHEPEPTDLTLF
jgi:putative SOS response-associated peptidase YedK